PRLVRADAVGLELEVAPVRVRGRLDVLLAARDLCGFDRDAGEREQGVRLLRGALGRVGGVPVCALGLRVGPRQLRAGTCDARLGSWVSGSPPSACPSGELR